MIRIYPSNEQTFTGSGYGTLPDAISCEITEELNGAYLLSMTYPGNGANSDKLELRNIILVKANPYGTPDAFRITKVEKDIDGALDISAQHVSYDLHGIPVAPYTANGVVAALAGLTSASQVANPFTFTTTRSVGSVFTVKHPTSCRELLGGSSGSLIDTYGGEWSFDKFTARLWLRRGQDRGVEIRYGKNLTDLDHETEGEVYTGAYPFWANDEGTLVTYGIVNAPGAYDFTRILTLDLSDKFETEPTGAQLQAAALAYLTGSAITAPNVSLRLSWIDLAQTEEYKHLTTERVELGDTVHVIYPALGITAEARVNKTTYDALLNRYTEIELGKAKHSLAETISRSADVINEEGHVDGGKIEANSIKREQLRADAIRSSNCESDWTIVYDGSDGVDHDELSYSWKIGDQIYAITTAESVPIGPAGGSYETGIAVNRALTLARFYSIPNHELQGNTYAVSQVAEYIGDNLPLSGSYGFNFAGSFLDLWNGEFHTAAMEITDTEARFKGDIRESRLQRCTGLTESYSATASGSVMIDSFDPDTYAASAYGRQDQYFTFYEDDIDTPGWFDQAGNRVYLNDLGISTIDAPGEGDVIAVTYQQTYTKIITLQDLKDLGLIP